MAVKSVIWCDECGTEFADLVAAREHEERNCMPWKVGDRVLFRYHLLAFPGTIFRLGELVGPGEDRAVFVESDEQLEEPETQFHTGKDFFVLIFNLQKLESVS